MTRATSPAPIRTQHCIWQGSFYQAVPVDGWSTGSPNFVITPSANWPRKDYAGAPLYYELTHVTTGFCVGAPYDAGQCTLEELADLADDLDAEAQWETLRDLGDFSHDQVVRIQKQIERFRCEPCATADGVAFELTYRLAELRAGTLFGWWQRRGFYDEADKDDE